jgi:two-component system sensor histidine kinase UhpB
VLAGQEGERLRVARELHDEVGQSLIALTLQAERAAERAAPDEARQFAEIAAKLRFNLDELRRIAHELRPEALDDLGLLNALIALANGTGVRGELTVERDLPAELPALSDEQELVVYRIAQEALSNVARHSGADRTVLRLRIAEGELRLTVDDNGRGLAAGEREGIGIGGMRERALLAGGRLRLGPRGDGEAGTEVELVLPLEAAGGRPDTEGDGR